LFDSICHSLTQNSTIRHVASNKLDANSDQ
jgi:hypothetical protein